MKVRKSFDQNSLRSQSLRISGMSICWVKLSSVWIYAYKHNKTPYSGFNYPFCISKFCMVIPFKGMFYVHLYKLELIWSVLHVQTLRFVKIHKSFDQRKLRSQSLRLSVLLICLELTQFIEVWFYAYKISSYKTPDLNNTYLSFPYILLVGVGS